MAAALGQRLSAGGQGHVLRFWAELGGAARRALAAELRDMDVAEINRFFRRARGDGGGGAAAGLDARMEPVPRDVLGSASRDRGLLPRWESRGRCGGRRGPARRGAGAAGPTRVCSPGRRAGGDRGEPRGRAAAGWRAGHPPRRPLPQGHVRRGAALPQDPLPPPGPAPAAAAAAGGGAARHPLPHPLVSTLTRARWAPAPWGGLGGTRLAGWGDGRAPLVLVGQGPGGWHWQGPIGINPAGGGGYRAHGLVVFCWCWLGPSPVGWSCGSAWAPLVSAGQGPVGWCRPPWQPKGPWAGIDPLDTSAIALGIAWWS